METGGGGGGRRPFFNDRRFTVAGPQRLRQNVQDLLSQFNRQFATDNPHLLHELADQLHRLQDLLSTNPNQQNNGGGVNQQNVNVLPTIGRQNRNEGIGTDGAGPSNWPGNAMEAGFGNNDGRLEQLLSNDDDVEMGEFAQQNPPNENPIANDAVVLNMEMGNGDEVPMDNNGQQANGEPTPPVQPQQPAAANAANPDAEWQRLVATMRAPEMQRIIRTVLNFGPFLFIILLKWMLTYAGSIVMLLSMVASFFYAENVVETVVSSSRTQQTPKWRLLSIIIVLTLNIGALYFFFQQHYLYLALLFQPTLPLMPETAGGSGPSFLTILWLVITTDFVAKYIFILAKCLVVSGPALVSAHRRKAQTYQWLEYTSHIYRHWLPTLPWSYYLTTTIASVGYVHNGLCTILFLAYLVMKIKLFRPKLKRWWRSSVALLRPTSFGYSPTTTELMKTGPTCSICYGEFSNPVQLTCKHIFCEECVTTWLDKQKTCPMCRTQVITGDNDWKDGKTSYCIQLV